MEKCTEFGLVMPEDLRTIEREGKVDASTKRQEKIARLKRQKQLEEELKLVNQKMRELQLKPNEKAEDELEEFFRESLLLQIGMHVGRTIEELYLLEQEMEMLKFEVEMKKMGIDFKSQQKEVPKTPAKVFTIPSRKKIASDVFKPSFLRHTVSIEQAGEIDYQEMLSRQKREEASKKEKEEKEGDEDDIFYNDTVKVYKDREWDDWKDDHPTGSGNTSKRG